MKPPQFSYHTPQTINDAVALLSTLDGARLLAGGQSLMPMLNMRFVLPDHVIDLNAIAELRGIRILSESRQIEIGAMTRQRDLEFSELTGSKLPLMQEALHYVGHRQTRNRGTIGGSLCHLDPAAELVAVAAVCDATMVATGPTGTREIPFSEFPRGYMEPALEPDEMLTAIRFPAWPDGHGYAFVETARRHGDFAIVSVAAMIERSPEDTIRRVAIAVGGVTAAPVRLPVVEGDLVGASGAPALFRAACEEFRKIDAVDDVHAPSSYRQHLAAVLSRRALEMAWNRARSIGPSS